MSHDNFDKAFDEAFEAATKRHAMAPDPSASWLKVERRLKRRRRAMQRLKLFPYVAAAFVLGAYVFGTPTVTKAFNPFFQTIKNMQEDVSTLIFGSNYGNASEAKTSAPVDELPASGTVMSVAEKSDERFATWEEAKTRLAFQPVEFEHVPEGYELREVRLFFGESETYANEAVLLYTGAEKRYRIQLRMLEQNESIASAADTASGSLETVDVNGNIAYLSVAEDGRSRLEYLHLNVYISIAGDLKRDEAIEIAKQMK